MPCACMPWACSGALARLGTCHGLTAAVRRAVYVYVSYRLFQLTNVLRIAVIPAKAGAELLRNAIIIAGCTGALVAAGALLLRLQLLGQ